MKRSKLLIIMTLMAVLPVLFLAVPSAPVMAASGVLSLTQYSGPVGTAVQIRGTGYTAGSTYTLTFGTGLFTTSLTGTVGAGGYFTTSIAIPAYPAGNYNFNATTSAGDNTNTTAQFTIIPYISLSAASGQIGSNITVNGTGFAAGANTYVYFDNVPVQGTVATGNGTFSGVTFTVPETFGGNAHTVKVADSSADSASLAFTVLPNIYVTPTSVGPGGQVTISGNGFSASSTITVTLDNINIPVQLSSNPYGTIPSTAISIPAVSGGTHTLKVSDGNGNFQTATITTSSSMSVSPQQGAVGSQVTVTGTGFASSKSISITYNGLLVAITPAVISDANGNFKATFDVPDAPAGIYTITASDGTTSLSAKFTSSAAGGPTGSTTGAVGTQIPLDGQGFAANAAVTIKYDNVAIATAQTDARGSFSTSFKLPAGKPGQHTVVATDGANLITFNVTVTPALSVSEDQGYIGDDVTVNGAAFTPGNNVTVTWDGQPVAAGAVDSSGSFSVTFKVPAAKNGIHNIVASDGVSNFTSAFTIEAATLSAPNLLYPQKGAKANTPAKFQWDAVTSPNGAVTYELQISHDSDFSNIVLDKKGLTANSYQFSEQEQKLLKSTDSAHPYYWRVAATDAAGDTGAWATPLTFVVGYVMPGWLMYFIYAVVIVVVFGIGILIGRRSVRI